MRTTLAFTVTSFVPSLAFAHTSLAEHGHPHAAAHPYLGVEALALFAAVAVVAGAIGYAVLSRRGDRQ